MRELLEEDVGALARAVVGLVSFRGDDPVPLELLEVDVERVATAAMLGGVVVTGEAELSPVPRLFLLLEGDLHERSLSTETQSTCPRTTMHCCLERIRGGSGGGGGGGGEGGGGIGCLKTPAKALEGVYDPLHPNPVTAS